MPRLNPFALPSETTLRFVVLVVAVVGSSLFFANSLYSRLPDGRWEGERLVTCRGAQRIAVQATGDPIAGSRLAGACLGPAWHREGRMVVAGAAGVLLLGSALYLAIPEIQRRRRRLRPLAPDVPEVAGRVAELAKASGLRREPTTLWNPLHTTGGAVAFGLPWRPRLALTAGLVATAFRDRPAFDAVLRHELAHLRNRDVAPTYLAITIWWAFLLGGIVAVLVSLSSGDAGFVGSILWRLVALALLVYLTRNAILRSRESYADVRASVWDGRGGALRRVLAGTPSAPPSGRLRRLTSVHPTAARRLATVDAPDGLFRLDVPSAFAVGAAAGMAFPNVVFLLGLFAMGAGWAGDMFADAALLVAPPVAAVLTIAVWRSVQASVARGGTGARTTAPALSLAAGLAGGQILSLDRIVRTAAGVAGVSGLGFGVLWVGLLVAIVLLFARWLVIVAEAWLPASIGSPRGRLFAAVAATSVVFAWGVGQFATVSTLLSSLARTGLWRVLAPDPAAVGGLTLDLVTRRTVTFLVVILIWAFPLAGWLARPRQRALGAWAFLDGGGRRPLPATPPPMRRPLVIAVAAAACFCVALLAWRLVVHASVPLGGLDAAHYLVSFDHRVELLAVVLQASAAVFVFLTARSSRASVALMAAFATGVLSVAAWYAVDCLDGCVAAISLYGGAACPRPLDTSSAWLDLKDWVAEGALLSFVAIPAAAAAHRAGLRIRTLRREERPA